MDVLVLIADMIKRHYKMICVFFAVFIMILYIWLPAEENLPAEKLVYFNACSLFTLNIWFGDFKTEKRMALLGKNIERLRPSIIAFQEVTSKNLGYLKQQPWFNRYNMVPNELPVNQGYCVVILTVFPVVRWRSIPFKNSRMRRNLLLAELKVEIDTQQDSQQKWFYQKLSGPVKHAYFTIATSHLESMAYSTLEREKQLQHSLQVLNEYDDVCLMGDLNLELKVDGKIQLPYPWFDAWLSFKNNTHHNGLTWDPENNPNIKMSEPEATTDRFDRVLCKLLNFRVESVDIVGKKPVGGVFFSDHYALYTKLEFGPDELASHQVSPVKEAKFIRPKDWKKFTH